MRRFLSIIIMAMLWLPLYAQAPATTSAVQSVSMVKTDWLSPFSKVEVNGPLRISFKRVNTAEEMKICYDTKGNLTSKFKADVDANGGGIPAGAGIGAVKQILDEYQAMGGCAVTIEPHLSVFDGLKDLEKAGNRTQIDEYCYESSDAAFDVACNALKALL